VKTAVHPIFTFWTQAMRHQPKWQPFSGDKQKTAFKLGEPQRKRYVQKDKQGGFPINCTFKTSETTREPKIVS